MKKEHDLTGKKFNKWTVLELSDYREKCSRDRFWLCRCKCGTEKPVKACYLKNGTSRQCVKCGHESQKKKGRMIPRCYWECLKRNAKKRSIPFSLTKKFVHDLLRKQSSKCALSGVPISFADTENAHLKGETTASVDRIDRNIGYFENNVQLVHKKINFMKHTLDQKEFISFCEAVVNKCC